MRVLAMDVYQRFSHLAQLLYRHRRTIQVGTRATVAVDHSPQQQASLGVEIMCQQPGRGIRRGREVEFGGHFGAVAAGANQTGIGTLAEGESERVDQDRLAGTRFAGKRSEARLQVEFQAVNEDEVADRQTTEHGVSVPLPP